MAFFKSARKIDIRTYLKKMKRHHNPPKKDKVLDMIIYASYMDTFLKLEENIRQS